MAEEIDLNPFGINDTKRYTSRAAEAVLFRPVEFPDGHVRLVDYLGGDDPIYYAMTAGVGAPLVHYMETKKLFETAHSIGATDGFKFAQLKFHVKMPIRSALQWVYPQCMSVNEYSARYSVMMDSGYTPQGAMPAGMEQIIQQAQAGTREIYEALLENGLARELSRLPMGLGTHTQFYVSANLLQLMDVTSRAKMLAQFHPDLEHLGPEAEAFESLMSAVAPEAVEALQKKCIPKKLEFYREKLEKDPDREPRYRVSKTKRVVVPAAEAMLWKPRRYLDQGWVMPTDYSGGDTAVVQAARTSYGKGTKHVSEDRGLTRYLRRGKHTTPFEQCEMQVEQKTPFFVFPRQGARHRTIDVANMLGAWPVLKDVYMPPDDEIRSQSKNNKQGRGDRLDDKTLQQTRALLEVERNVEAATDEQLSQGNVPQHVREQLMGVWRYTRSTAKIDLHNSCHFLRLRDHSHAQKEIQLYAKHWAAFVNAVAPSSYEAFVDYEKNPIVLTGVDEALVRRMLEEGLKSIPFEWYKEAGLTTESKKSGKDLKGREAKELDAKLARLLGE